MTNFMLKDTILYVYSLPSSVIKSISKLKTPEGKKIKLAVIGDAKDKTWQNLAEKRQVDFIIPTNLSKPLRIAKDLLPYQDRLLAITSRTESKMNEFAKIIPHVPYLKTPTATSLIWSSDKIAMRERLQIFNKKIIPKFLVVKDATNSTIKEVEIKLKFPVIIKPSSLAASRLISICYHKEEFETTLKKTFKKLPSLYKEHKVTTTPRILVEEFMEGSMYSIDGYVNARGKVYFCPMVFIRTGISVGFDDFFGYMQLCPTQLKSDSITAAQKVATEAVHALGLRSTTTHIELMRTEDGWKIIEVGARVGGFRQEMYDYSFGFDHGQNDVLIHISQVPIIKKKPQGYTVAMKFFAKKEGVIESIKGIKKVKELKSFKKIIQNKKVGDRGYFAKNGGSSVINLIMFNKNRSALFADIRRAEQVLKILVE